jgi:hypothetical protein
MINHNECGGDEDAVAGHVAIMVAMGYTVSACGGMVVIERVDTKDGWHHFEVARSNDPHAPNVMEFKDATKAARRFVRWCAKMELGTS